MWVLTQTIKLNSFLKKKNIGKVGYGGKVR